MKKDYFRDFLTRNIMILEHYLASIKSPVMARDLAHYKRLLEIYDDLKDRSE